MITEWMVTAGIAQNGFAAGHIYAGLKLQGLTESEQKARCELYRKDMLPTWQAYELAIAGIDPDNVTERQIDMFEVNNE